MSKDIRESSISSTMDALDEANKSITFRDVTILGPSVVPSELQKIQ